MKHQFEIFERFLGYKLKTQIDLVFMIITFHNFITTNSISTNIYNKETPITKSQIQVQNI